MPTPLLATKFFPPPARPERVSRPRLLALLDAALAHPLTVVVAPAGAGKSTLLADWIAQRGRPVAWLSLEPDDDESPRFWRYVAAAWQGAAPGVGALTLSALESAVPPPIEAALGALVNDLAAHPGPACLVLEDYHAITRAEIHRGMEFLVDHLPPQAHVIVSTRTDPPLSLARRRGQGRLAEVRAGDLRFSLEEARAYLNGCLALELTAPDVAILEQRTEGWAVGLQLAALSLRGVADRHARVAVFGGEDRYVADYLLEQVLECQPAEVRAFLLRTAHLERLCAPLCDAVTGGSDGADMLAYLERANLLLVPLDDRRYWYRYHHLLGELLRRRGAADASVDGREVHRRAAAWFAGQGLRGDAIQHALAAGDADAAAEWVEAEAMATIFRAETLTVQRWLRALPDQVIARRPILATAQAWVVALNEPHDLRVAEKWLLAAEQAAAAAPAAVQATIRGHVLTARALIARNLGGDELRRSVGLSRQALAQLAAPDATLYSALRFNLGAALLSLGQVDEAVAELEEARRAAGPGHYAGAMAVYVLADTAHLRGRLPEAEAYCREALDELSRGAAHGLPLIAGALQIALGRIYLEWDRLDEAEALLAQGVRAMALTSEATVAALGWQGLAQIHAMRGQAGQAMEAVARARAADTAVGGVLEPAIWWTLGRMDKALAERALRWARGVALPGAATPLPGMIILDAEYAAHTLAARIRIAAARRGDGLADERAYLQRQAQEARRRGWADHEITLMTLQALAHAACGQEEAALAALRDALALAEPGGYLRRFLDHGAPLARLLYRWVQRGDATAYASRLLSAVAEMPAQPAEHGVDGLVEALSARELEILGLIAAGLSNAEIALRLRITPGTVKVHAHRLYGKLGVSGRTAALARARALGLLGGQ